ncbi:hypothetical protein D3C87_866540 [compost metagenome]
MISEGSLQDFSFSDLLQIIGLNSETGLLRLTSEGREGLLDCKAGEITGAKALELQGEEAVYALFHWETGTFTFESGASASLANIRTPLSELAKEGIRRVDQWRSIRRDMPQMTLRARFRVLDRPSGGLSSAAANLVDALKGAEGQTLGQIATANRRDELTIAQALLELWREGLLQVETAPEEALRSVFGAVSEGIFERFASISGLKMTEGLESRLNTWAREQGADLRWRNGRVQDGLPAILEAPELLPVYRGFLVEELGYVAKIHGESFVSRVIEALLETFSAEEHASWKALDLESALSLERGRS